MRLTHTDTDCETEYKDALEDIDALLARTESLANALAEANQRANMYKALWLRRDNNYRITTEGETVVTLGGYVSSADAARLVPVSYQRIGQLGASLGRVESNGSVYVSVPLLAERWPEAAAAWRWFDLDGRCVESPLGVSRE